MNKKQKVFEHLKKFGSITSWEAIELYGATRLSDIIFKLRKVYEITDTWYDGVDRYGNDIRYKRYFLVCDKKQLDEAV